MFYLSSIVDSYGRDSSGGSRQDQSTDQLSEKIEKEALKAY